MGGGPDTANHVESANGAYSIAANQVELLSRPPLPPAVPGPYVITLLAGGTGTDGLVNVRGSQGVRITSGPPLLPPTSSDSTAGVELIAREAQKITIQRGLLPVDQTIALTPSGITVDAGMGQITIQSLSKITLSVAGGLSTITLGPEGVDDPAGGSRRRHVDLRRFPGRDRDGLVHGPDRRSTGSSNGRSNGAWRDDHLGLSGRASRMIEIDR
jgi:hypothetical protein